MATLHDKANESQAALEYSRKYMARRYQPLPVLRGKNPGFDDWPNFRCTAEDLPKHFSNGSNVGLLTGTPSNNLVNVDFDCRFARLLTGMTPATGMVSGRKSAGVSHHWYICEVETKKYRDPNCEDEKTAMLVELRSDGCQTLVPPSTHPDTGETYEWMKRGQPAVVDSSVLQPTVGRVAAAALLCRNWQRGKRHDLALATSGALLRANWLGKDVMDFLSCIVTATGDEERDDRLQAVITTGARLAEEKPASGIPTLKNLLSETVANKLVEWLELDKVSLFSANGNKPRREDEEQPALAVVCMADVVREAVDWLWFPYIPVGKLTLLEGDPGIGKSWLTAAIAAIVSNGCRFPGMEGRDPGAALILTAEDGLADTLKPRLESLGATHSRIHALNEPLTLDEGGMLRLKAAIAHYQPLLVSIDPLFAFTGGKVDIHRANECRSITAQLAAIAEKYHCAILAVRHLGKSRGAGHALNAGIGSIDITAAARSVLLAGSDPEEESTRAMAHIKSNLAPHGPSIGFSLASGLFLWTGESELTAADILSHGDRSGGGGKTDAAKEFLREVMSDAEVESEWLMSEAQKRGISEKTLKRAKSELKVTSRKEGFGRDGKWFCWLSVESL